MTWWRRSPKISELPGNGDRNKKSQMDSEFVKSPEYLKGFFAKLAPSYDRFNRIAGLFLDGYWRDQVANLAQPGMSVLDLCTGTGDLAFKIARKIGPQGRLVGIDFSPEMLALAETKKEQLNLNSRIDFCLCRAEELPFESGSFDIVVSAFAMRNVRANLEKVLNEIFRVLKPCGQTVILEFSRPKFFILKFLHSLYLKTVIPLDGKIIFGSKWSSDYLTESILHFFSPEDFCQMLSKAGFSQVRYFPLNFGIVVIHRARKGSK
jgi:demethylmenaquinone methyltransferase/2-methoxy-6-polyprenyl-1,4-benzoquinol methylase